MLVQGSKRLIRRNWEVQFAAARGFLRTRMTESPRRNILLMKRSLFTGLAFFLPEKKMSIRVEIHQVLNSATLGIINWTSLHFEWSKRGWVANGPDF